MNTQGSKNLPAKNSAPKNPAPMTPAEFASLGNGSIAYVRPVLSEHVESLFPGAPTIQPGLQLFALLGADGSPIFLTDSRDAALANAMQHELHTVTVH